MSSVFHITQNLARDRQAWFSLDQRYRYLLRIALSGSVLVPAPRPCIFVMLNPSVADAFDDDPTVRLCCGYARRWGYTDLFVANLFAYRSTDPAALAQCTDPVGPHNDEILRDLPAGMTVVAWGNHPMTLKRSSIVQELLRRPLMCLELTKSGAPHHPLRLKKDLCPMPWPGGSAE